MTTSIGATAEPYLFGAFVENVFWPEKVKKLRTTTLSGYKRDLSLRLMPAFADVPMSEIGVPAIQAMIEACPTRRQARSAKGTLSSVLSLAVRLGLIEENAALGFRFEYPQTVEIPAVKDIVNEDEHPEGVWLTTFDEIYAFLAALKESSRGRRLDVMVLRAYTLGLLEGLRCGEILGMDAEDVRLGQGCLIVRQTYTHGAGGTTLTLPKTRQMRAVPLLGSTVEMIKELGLGKGPWITNAYGRRCSPSQMRKVSRAARERAGLPNVTLMTARHSFATACINAGMKVELLSKWLGHCNPSVTQAFYVRPKLENLAAEKNRLKAVIDR